MDSLVAGTLAGVGSSRCEECGYIVTLSGSDALPACPGCGAKAFVRSLAADVRFDDPTVSRRHALVIRDGAGVRVLDDHSLNGVFVNGERVDSRVLADGDEIVVGRYRLAFLDVVRVAEPTR